MELLEGLKLDDFGDFQLIFIPIPFYLSSSIAVLIGFPKIGKRPLSTIPEHSPSDYLHKNLKAFFSLPLLAVAAIRAKGLEELAKKQLLYLGHEAGQLSGGLDWLTKIYEDVEEFEKKLSKQYSGNKTLIIRGLKKKIEDLCSDIRGYTGLLSFVFDTAERMGSDAAPQVNASWFRPYGDVLAKWKDTYRQECEQKFLQMKIELPELVDGSRSNDPWKPEMWGDPFLFEQIVYNLINNAEKYSYRGTRIDVDCKLRSLGKNAPYILTVTNYGLQVDSNDDEIFKPFKRGRGAEDLPGLGLGLYIVRTIVEEIHKGKVKIECDKPISNYNVPLIKPYIQLPIEGKDEALVENLKYELIRLERKGLYDNIVAYEPESEQSSDTYKKIQLYKPSNNAILNEIDKPTYKVTIIAELPFLKYEEVKK